MKAFLFSVISMMAVAAIGAQDQAPQKPPGGGEGNELLRCIYNPKADSQSSSLPNAKVGFKFLLQRNNSNHIAVDTYTLNDSNQPIKQVGHAEVVSSVTEITSTTKASDLISGLTLAEDSPFEFEIVLDSSGADTNGRFSATVETVTLFTGANYAQVPVSCRLAPAAGSQQKASSQSTRLN